MGQSVRFRVFQYLANRYILTLRKVPTSDIPISTTQKEVKELVQKMTLQEKIDYIAGKDGFSIGGIDRLGIPPIWMADATSGVRGINAPVTIFPSAIALAASWNRELIQEVGAVIGEECRATGVSILLAPGVNIARLPICGRNFEYMGEDPYLAGGMASAYVKGVQSKQVGVTVKHFACNNSEYDRHKTDAVVDEKTLHELYLSAFEKVVTSGAKGVMTAYNQINGTYASEHNYLLSHVLRDRWGFEGIVISDWNSLYSTKGPFFAGMDLEMPQPRWFTQEAIRDLIATDPTAESIVDEKVTRLLSFSKSLGILDRPVVDDRALIGVEAHHTCAYTIASQSIVLLKNDNLLPLQVNKQKNIVVLGRLANAEPIGGGGSSYIKQGSPGISVAEQLRQEFPDVTVKTIQGRWWKNKKKRELVAQADAVIIVTGFDHTYESEAYDRVWALPDPERITIEKAVELNSRTVVILHSGGALEMASWVERVNAVLFAWYLGGFSAQAVVDVLVGKTNPSGKLPISIAKKIDDYLSMRDYPSDGAKFSMARIMSGQGDPTKRSVQKMVYQEGVMVGYRQFDTVGPLPLFPFGFGLSYTQFSYDNISITQNEEQLVVSCYIQNSGALKGAEVVQLYVRPTKADQEHPFQQLKGFERSFLLPKEKKRIEFVLTARDFSEYSVATSQWLFIKGQYTLCIGSSSRDIRLSRELVLGKFPDYMEV